MPSERFAIVILAAGQGTRLKSNRAKVLHRAGGRPLVEHVLRACLPLGAAETFVIVGHQADEVRAVVEPFGAKTILQQPQRGTGHALLVARPVLENAGVDEVLVLPGDSPLIRTESLAMLLRAHRASSAAATLLTATLETPQGYGRILRNPDGTVAAIVEEKALSAEQRTLREVNSSIYVFSLPQLWPALEQVRPENVHREIYLTDAIELLHRSGCTVRAERVGDAREILGCNTRAELAEVDRIFRQRKCAEVMAAGVTIYLPETVLLDPDVQVGADTVIEPGVQLLGTTRVGTNCWIGTGTVLVDTVVEDDVLIHQNCRIAGSRIGRGCRVGPFAHLRDGAELRPEARVGNYVEVKKSLLAEGVKAMHLSYLGDATIGPHTNIGAGTITCNYDGERKHPTTIGERVFVGSGTELVAPVTVGNGAYIAAGSTVTEDVPADALAIARARQVYKPGWAAARRARLSNPAAMASRKMNTGKRKAPAQNAKRKAGARGRASHTRKADARRKKSPRSSQQPR
jgi:bifunctional UDP-N-acetylglucosamine pyrophosphorylase/glucosamine-1-phosphate N-acetyltransferase